MMFREMLQAEHVAVKIVDYDRQQAGCTTVVALAPPDFFSLCDMCSGREGRLVQQFLMTEKIMTIRNYEIGLHSLYRLGKWMQDKKK